ncbi:MAG: GNAT family N-acetyltransferase [Elusimicrobia bacterium]|nr:GNAT family N-acetyltransferase [Elusimicrobiota bacterium]
MTLAYARELDGTQVVQALTDSHSLWGGSSTLELRLEKTRARLESAGPTLFRMSGLVDADGRVAASLKLYGLELDAPRGPVPTAGIGAVFTPEPRRRQGLAERLLRTVLEEQYSEGAGAAWLFSDIAPAYYEKTGFRRFPALTRVFETGRLPSKDPFEARPARPDDAGRMRAWYAAAAPAGSLRPRREASIWDFMRGLNAAGPDLVLSRRGVEVGYLSVCFDEGKLWVEEWAAPGEPEDRVWAAVRILAEEKGLKTAAGWLPPWSAAVGGVTTERSRSIPMLAAAPGGDSLLGHPPQGAHFGSLDHF